MKKILLGLTLFPFLASAQTTILGGNSNIKLKDPQPVIGKVLYDFSYISDTTHSNLVKKEVMLLEYSKDYSKFSSQTFQIEDSLSQVDVARQIKEQSGSKLFNINMKPVTGSSDIFFSDKKEIFSQKEFIEKLYLIKDSSSNIDWNIEDSTRTIGGYTCQKATGISHGRPYIAWFTTDLPYSYGPRKLQGLPGLILEAYDNTERIVYKFKQYNDNIGKEIGIPENSISTTSKEFDKMKAAFKANPSAFFNNIPSGKSSNTGGGNTTQSVQTVSMFTIDSDTPSTTQKKSLINFPIDLVK